IIAIADEGIDRDDFDAGVVGALEGRDHRLLVAGSYNHRVYLLCDERVDNRSLERSVELGRAVYEEGGSQLVRLSLGSFLHRHIDRITFSSHKEGNGVLLRITPTPAATTETGGRARTRTTSTSREHRRAGYRCCSCQKRASADLLLAM